MEISAQIDLKGRVAIVTGAARGIGKAIALALGREGADLVIADLIDMEDTVHSLEKMGRQALAVKADVSRRAEVVHLIEKSINRFQKVDILVNNAGTCHRVSLEDITEEQWDQDINTILKGAFFCTQTILPHMKQQGYGKIVNISSISGKIGGAVSRTTDDPEARGSRSGPAYAAAKGGVIAFTKWVAKDVGCYGVYVNGIAPGPVTSEMTKGYSYPVDTLSIARMGEPQDIAEAAVFLASNASNYITGQILNVDGGWVMD
jgi:3-oxoacyl-[acyl-carrier protein] reductase